MVLVEFLAINRKLPIMAMLASKIFTTAKKVTSTVTGPNDHWIKSNAHPTELVWHVLVRLILLDPYIIILY